MTVTADLQQRYLAWLANEHAAAAAELDGRLDYDQEIVRGNAEDWRYYRVRAPIFHFPDAPDIETVVRATRPSTRAALVLSTVGCLRADR